MKKLMKQLGVQEMGEVLEVRIRTREKTYLLRNPQVTEMNVQGQKVYQVVGEPEIHEGEVAEDPKGFSLEDIKLVAEKAGVSEPEARKALEAVGGEPAEAIIHLLSKRG